MGPEWTSPNAVRPLTVKVPPDKRCPPVIFANVPSERRIVSVPWPIAVKEEPLIVKFPSVTMSANVPFPVKLSVKFPKIVIDSLNPMTSEPAVIVTSLPAKLEVIVAMLG